MSWRVRGSAHGRECTIRGGFASQEAAEEHPVTLAAWDKVWVEEAPGEPVAKPKQPTAAAGLPPRPWQVIQRGGLHYLAGSDGVLFASLFGTAERRVLVGEKVLEAIEVLGEVEFSLAREEV